MPGMPRGPKSRVQYLEVENFKSYKGTQEIGPFHAFTAVIGPNGSGKSNVMDAISFVLGVKGAQLRGSLKEMLYTYTEGSTVDRPTHAHVKLVLETDGEDPTSFKRSIVPGRSEETYTSQYAVNDRSVTWAAYEEKLKSFGILVKARNFLVFQGDIEAVAGKQPMDLTRLFESISGSDAYKADYEKYDAEMKEAQERFAFVQSKKKTTAAEKRQKKEQKAEAEKHIKMQEQLEKLKATYYLWQLYHTELDASAAQEQLEEQQGLLKEAAKQLQATDRELKEKKKVVAGLVKKKLVLEQKAKKRKGEVEKKNPEHVKNKMELTRVKQRLEVAQKELEREQKKETDKGKEVKKLKKELQQLEEDKAAQEGAQEGEELSQEVRNEFRKLQEKARARTVRQRHELKSLQSEQETEASRLAEPQQSLAEVANYLKACEDTSEASRKERQAVEAELAQTKAQLQRSEEELTQFKVKCRHKKTQRSEWEVQLRQNQEKLQSSKASQREDRSQTNARKTISDLKRLFPGVHGQVCDLGKVTQQAYSLPLSVVMGKEMKAIVVDNDQVAKQCITHLNQRRLPPMTFLPLASVKCSEPSERLRQLGGTARLAVDLIEFDDKFKRAFLSACGSTLVCDGEEEAKRLAFDDPNQRRKVVTKEGLLISKSGAMTGGGSGDLGKGGSSFNDAEYHRLKEERDQIMNNLAGAESEEDLHVQELRWNAELSQLKAKISHLEKTIESYQGRAGSSNPENLAREKEGLEAKIQEAQQEMEPRSARIAELQTGINDFEDNIFADLSKKAGLDNIREHMEQYKEVHAQMEKASIEYKRRHAAISQKLALHQRPNLGLAKLSKELETLGARAQVLEEAEERFREAAAAFEEQTAAEAEELEELKQAIADADSEVDALKKVDKEHTAQGSKRRQEVKRLEVVLENVGLKRDEILKKAQLEEVSLPMVDDDEAQPMDTGEEGEGEYARMAALLDFDGLSRQHKATKEEAERDRLDEEFLNDIQEQQATLQKVLPNLKAGEQYQEAKEKDDKEKAELEEARQSTKESSAAFHDTRQKRADAFLKAFDHIKGVIDPIYKDLTKSKVHPMGGTAYLSMVSSEEEPFLTGISFTAMPPSKRWRQMEALSGGEKTVAALALLFAIHSYHPSPFFVLDEVDAALDASNVAKVANYIREKTRTAEGREEFQAVVISLKDYFFSKADSLVGVTKDPLQGSSATFTMDLNVFGEPES